MTQTLAMTYTHLLVVFAYKCLCKAGSDEAELSGFVIVESDLFARIELLLQAVLYKEAGV